MGGHRLVVVLLLPLAACPTVDLGDTPTEIGLCNPAGGVEYFQDMIWPNYVVRGGGPTSCASVNCHVAGGNGLDFQTASPVDYAAVFKRAQPQLNCGTPNASPFLTRPLAGVDPHGGGDIFQPNDPAVQIFLDWFK